MSASKALGLGAISGLRSLSGLAFVSRAASGGHLDLEGTPFAFLISPRLSKALIVMESGELIGDKLPMTPSRTTTLPLLGRAVSGAIVGGSLFASEKRRTATGILLGSSAAVMAAFTGERLRSLVGRYAELPDPVVALAEDAIVTLVGLRFLRDLS